MYTAIMATRRQREQLRHERMNRRRDELVALVEQAAISLGRARRKSEGIEELWRLSISPDSDLAHNEITERTTAVEDGRAAYSRLLLRFDEHDSLPATYREATGALDGYLSELGAYNRGEDYKNRRESTAIS